MNTDQKIGYQKCLKELTDYYKEVQDADKLCQFPTGCETFNHFILPKLEELSKSITDDLKPSNK